MGFFSNWFGDKTGIEYFKDFGYNQLHTTTHYDEYEKMYCSNASMPRSNDERYNAVNSIYNNLFGKDVDTKQVSHMYNGTNSRPIFIDDLNPPKIGDPGTIAYVDVNITQDMADYLNKELAQDNPLRGKMDINGDGDLSQDEISNYFDKFRVGGDKCKYVTVLPDGTIAPVKYQLRDTGKISHFDMENIYALKNGAIIPHALFTKYSDTGGIDTDVKLSFKDIADKSIISESDFRKLDVAFDGTEDGLISKDVFDKFEFDKNGDHVIDKNEYAEGMQRVDEYLKEKADTINTVPSSKESNNECATINMHQRECQEVS